MSDSKPLYRLRERVASLSETGEGRQARNFQNPNAQCPTTESQHQFMRKLEPEERLKHGVIVLLKKEDYEDLKRFSESQNTSHAAWTRKYVLKALERARKLEKIEIAEREAAAEREFATRDLAAKPKPKSKTKKK